MISGMRGRFAARMMAAGLAALALAGCSAFEDEETPPPAAQEPQAQPKVPVEIVENMELGRLYKGYMLTAYARAPGAGYYEPELRPRYGGRPSADGFYEFDFVVRPPEEAVAGSDPARRVRGDVELTTEQLRGVAGVRVWAARGSVEGRF
ncbi:MAG: hypothetical protein ACK5MQ_17765 [Pikeienuella sp.]